MSCVISKLRLKFTVKRRFGRRCPKIYQTNKFFIQSELFKILSIPGSISGIFPIPHPITQDPGHPGDRKDIFFTIIPDCITVNLLLILFDQSIFNSRWKPGRAADETKIPLFHWIIYSANDYVLRLINDWGQVVSQIIFPRLARRSASSCLLLAQDCLRFHQNKIQRKKCS